MPLSEVYHLRKKPLPLRSALITLHIPSAGTHVSGGHSRRFGGFQRGHEPSTSNPRDKRVRAESYLFCDCEQFSPPFRFLRLAGSLSFINAIILSHLIKANIILFSPRNPEWGGVGRTETLRTYPR